MTIGENNGGKSDSFADCSSGIYSCTDEDLSKGSRFFDFDLEVVNRALGNDEQALKEMCNRLGCKLDRIERQIARLCPGWPQEQLEHVRDLFVHDRFLNIFIHPPKEKIENFNALCWKFLHDSIADTWRYYRCSKRNFQIEISADKKELETDENFWERHGTEISLDPSLRPCDLVERHDLMSLVNQHLDTLSPQKKMVVNLWKIGHSEKEIASMVNMTVGNVGSIVSRTIAYLRKKLCKKVG